MADQTTLRCALADTWHVNNRVNLRLLDALTDEQLAATIFPRGKAVTSYFVHIHMARFYWLERRARIGKQPQENAGRDSFAGNVAAGAD